jgi:hypothetical protein
VRWLAVEVSVSNYCPEPVRYSEEYFRIRVGELPGEIVGAHRPLPAGGLQPTLRSGDLPAMSAPGTVAPTTRGWVIFSDVPEDVRMRGELFLDYVTPLDALGDIPLPAPQEPVVCVPLRRLSLPLYFTS